jgi:hypothetical protein
LAPGDRDGRPYRTPKDADFEGYILMALAIGGIIVRRKRDGETSYEKHVTNVTSFAYDGMNRLATETIEGFGTGLAAYATSDHDIAGNILAMKGYKRMEDVCGCV